MTGRVYVNKKSGKAHLTRDCVWIVNVPDGALRVVGGSALPRLRVCATCLAQRLGTPSRWDADLRDAERALARNRADIDAAGSAGTPSGRRSDWRLKPDPLP